MALDFWPEDAATEFYCYDSEDLESILERAQEKWPGIGPGALRISAEYIHTHCIGYDRYDPGDYSNFLRISLK